MPLFAERKSTMDLKKCRVLVTATSYGKTNPSLLSDLEKAVGKVIYNPTGKPLPSQALQLLLPGMDGLIAGLDEIDREAIEAGKDLKVIARYGVGVDNVDLAAAKQRGITVTNTPGANAASVAELTVGLILSLARHIPKAVWATRSGEWPRLAGISLEGKVIGLLGLGAIGKQVARRLAGFDCRLVACDPYADQAFTRKTGIDLVERDQVIAEADFLSLHLPLLPETRQMVNQAFLERMKPSAYLINTSRGELIDEPALIEALQTGHLRGAALDVFPEEPPPADHPLLKMPQVLVTPHSASHTDGAMDNMGRMALHDCLAVLGGEKPQYPVS
jgi:D-3-phosphoglycerate dehydrogenase